MIKYNVLLEGETYGFDMGRKQAEILKYKLTKEGLSPQIQRRII